MLGLGSDRVPVAAPPSRWPRPMQPSATTDLDSSPYRRSDDRCRRQSGRRRPGDEASRLRRHGCTDARTAGQCGRRGHRAAATVEGYQVGGKTGTANKLGEDGRYTEVTRASFVGMAPMSDRKRSWRLIDALLSDTGPAGLPRRPCSPTSWSKRCIDWECSPMSAPGSTVGEVSGRVGGLVVGDPDIWLGDVTHDSALAGPQVLFVAVKGATHDGHDYVRSAVAAGLRLSPSKSRWTSR